MLLLCSFVIYVSAYPAEVYVNGFQIVPSQNNDLEVAESANPQYGYGGYGGNEGYGGYGGYDGYGNNGGNGGYGGYGRNDEEIDINIELN